MFLHDSMLDVGARLRYRLKAKMSPETIPNSVG